MKKLIYLLLFLPLSVTAQTSSENYTKTTTYKVETPNSIINPTPTQAQVTVTYFDGLGRPKQQIAHRQSGSGKDIISHMEYDGLGRQVKQYLPYADGNTSLNFRTGALTDLIEFYSQGDPILTGNPHFATATNPYTETFFEPSPLNRTRKIGAPGDIWKGNENNDNDKTIKFEYRTNTSNEVRRYYATTTWNAAMGVYVPTLNQSGFYNANELFVTVVKDENWTSGLLHTTREYKDKQGRVVLKRTYGVSQSRQNEPDPYTAHDTYYVYDEYSNLTYVITPLVDKTQTISSDALNGLCYQYRYDHRNRLVEKKLPGRQWEYIVYDKLDRPVATGPHYSPFTNISDNGWLVTKYDRLNRPIITAWMPSVFFGSQIRKSLQDTYNNQSVHSENKIHTTSNNTVNGVSFRYTNNSHPTANYHILTINYFDDYNYPNAPTIPSTIEGQTVFYTNSNKPKGLATASWARALSGVSSSAPNEFSYFLYDKYANPIRTHTKNYQSGRTEVDSKFDFSGKVEYTKTRHKLSSNSPELEILESFEYSPQDRLLKHTHKINQMDEQVLSSNIFDELGQLIRKDVGSDIFSNDPKPPSLQWVDYKYNIRGWLTEINDVTQLQQQNAPLDLFAFKINYTATLQDYDGSEVKNLYNGNIAETLWRSGSDNVLRSYGYAYDPMNRLTNAIYGKPDATTPITHNYNEWLSYDANGNILALGRNGISDTHTDVILIDDLVYEYKDDFSNILVAVDDLTTNDAGFKKGNTTQNDDFEYDANGNLIIDRNKNISSITYNHLNLPVKITFENDQNKFIRYIYTATGEKLMKTVKHDDSLSHTRYAHGFQYYDNVLQFFHTPEGYVKNTPDGNGNPSFDYVYQYKDHLGNVRVNYAQDPQSGELEILEESHYYPFGLQHSNYNSRQMDIKREEINNEKSLEDDVKPHIPVANRGYQYKFNGMEYQSEFNINMYDFGARNYDPAIGRWMNIDPMAEKMRRHSPYNYAFNNPIYFIDPDGMEPLSYEAVGAYSIEKSAFNKAGSGRENLGAAMMGFVQITQKMVENSAFSSRQISSSVFSNSATTNASSSGDEGNSSSNNAGSGDGGGNDCPEPCPWGSINPKPLTFVDKWAGSDNVFAQISYDMINEPYITFQALNPFDDRITNLQGFGLNDREITEAGTNALASLLPISRGVNQTLRPLNSAQFSQRFNGSVLTQTSHTVRGYYNRIYNNVMRSVDEVNVFMKTTLTFSNLFKTARENDNNNN